MASGVEMLGQMSETEALAGPVQGGNMVVKPNEVPVGGAAMLAKAMRGQANKGVGGIYELPSQQQPTPQFMQMAQQGVKNDMTRMARTIEAEAPPGHMLSYITPEEAGILQMLGGSGDINPTTGIPQFDKEVDPRSYAASGQASSSNNASSSVNQGPPGGSGSSGSSTQGGGGSDNDWIGQSQKRDVYYNKDKGGQGTTNQNISNEAYDNYNAELAKAMGAPEPDNRKQEEQSRDFQNEQRNEIQKQLDELNKKKQDAKNNKLSKEDKKLQKKLNSELSAIKKIQERLSKTQFDLAKDDMASSIENMSDEDIDKEKKRLRKLRYPTSAETNKLNALINKTTNNMYLKGANMIGQNFDPAQATVETLGDPMTMALVGNNLNLISDGKLTEAGQRFYNEYDDKIGFLGMNDEASFIDYVDSSISGVKDGTFGQGSQAQRAIDPESYYSDSDKSKYYGSGGTADSMAELAGLSLQNPNLSEKMKRRIVEAREINQRSKGNNQNNRPAVMQQTQEEVIDTPDGVVDEEAQTMKYTSPRTGGTETSVPLQRRFRTDPTQEVAQYRTTPRTEADILKYATQGTTGEGIGLEPFSEYQRRRRKALGLEDLGLFN